MGAVPHIGCQRKIIELKMLDELAGLLHHAKYTVSLIGYLGFHMNYLHGLKIRGGSTRICWYVHSCILSVTLPK